MSRQSRFPQGASGSYSYKYKPVGKAGKDAHASGVVQPFLRAPLRGAKAKPKRGELFSYPPTIPKIRGEEGLT